MGAILLAPAVTQAKGTISGTVLNKTTGEPVDFATVQLIDAKTKKPLTIGTNTDADGTFSLPNVADGSYIVKISNLGSVDLQRNVTIAGADVALGKVRMADDTKMLQEVVVEGVRSQMRFELDRKVFQVDSSIAAAGQSASELLETIPSVEVDQDGEVSLRGDTSVTIWINGKESGLSADNRAQILEQIPAETIDRIEVITNPSAKYSPEGTEGIINIILKKDRRAGYFGSAEIGANSRGGGNVGFSINVNSGKWDSYASIGFRMRNNTGGSESRRLYLEDDTFLNSDGTTKNHGNNLFLRAGTTFHATDKDDISLSAFGMFGHRWGSSRTDYTSNVPGQWISDLNNRSNKSDSRGAHVELGYLHKWSDNHTLDMTLGYNYWGGPQWNSYLQDETWEDEPGNLRDEAIYQEQNQTLNVNSIEAKLDYTIQLNKWLKLDAGYNGNYNHENTPVTTYQGTSAADMALLPQLYNDFIYTNNITALYATLGGKVKNFSFSAGLRGETWQVRTRSLEYGETKADVPQWKSNKFALFPSAFISWSLPHDNELQLNYTRRIRRPFGGQLNSFRNISDPTNISYGNPELEPQYSNAFELNYIKTWLNHMISVSAYVRSSEDLISRISYMVDNVMYTTNANVSSQVNSGCEIVVKNSFLNGKLDFTTTGNLYDGRVKAWHLDFNHDGTIVPVSGSARNSFSWDIREMISARLPWGISLQATGRYSSGHVSAQGTHGSGWSVDAGLRKNLGDWSFSLNCRDIFDSRKFTNNIITDQYTQSTRQWRGGRTLSLTIKYAFGNMRAKRSRDTDREPADRSGYETEEGMD